MHHQSFVFCVRKKKALGTTEDSKISVEISWYGQTAKPDPTYKLSRKISRLEFLTNYWRVATFCAVHGWSVCSTDIFERGMVPRLLSGSASVGALQRLNLKAGKILVEYVLIMPPSKKRVFVLSQS